MTMKEKRLKAEDGIPLLAVSDDSASDEGDQRRSKSKGVTFKDVERDDMRSPDPEMEELEELEQELGLLDGHHAERQNSILGRLFQRRTDDTAKRRMPHSSALPRWNQSPERATFKRRNVLIVASCLILAVVAGTAGLYIFGFRAHFIYKPSPIAKNQNATLPTPEPEKSSGADMTILPMTGRVYTDDFIRFADEVVLTIKSGAAVFFSRMPIHFIEEAGNLGLIKNRIILADFDGEVNGMPIVNVLANVSETVKDQDDFKPYWEIQELQKHNVPLDKANGGWQLDKYKFLPLHGYTYRAFPNASFTVHIEGDTYLIQEGLLRWLYEMDPDEQIMAGAVSLINDFAFAHGGSGYVLSRGMMQASWARNPHLEDEYDDVVRDNCCGDFVLSEVFRDIESKPNSTLQYDSPNIDCGGRFQGAPPNDILFDWWNSCQPIFTFHHITAEDSHALYHFERSMYPKLDPTEYIRYIDVFDHFYPQFLKDAADNGVTSFVQLGWDVHAEDRHIEKEDGLIITSEVCEQKCHEWDECVNWTFREPDNDGDRDKMGCWIGDRIRFGKAASGVTSGFMLDRLHTWRERRDCRPPPWAARVEEPTPDMADSEEVANSADRVEVETE